MMKKQKEYCKNNNLPMFVSLTGKCWSCQSIIKDNGNSLITGCPYSFRSFCD